MVDNSNKITFPKPLDRTVQRRKLATKEMLSVAASDTFSFMYTIPFKFLVVHSITHLPDKKILSIHVCITTV